MTANLSNFSFHVLSTCSPLNLFDGYVGKYDLQSEVETKAASLQILLDNRFQVFNGTYKGFVYSSEKRHQSDTLEGREYMAPFVYIYQERLYIEVNLLDIRSLVGCLEIHAHVVPNSIALNSGRRVPLSVLVVVDYNMQYTELLQSVQNNPPLSFQHTKDIQFVSSRSVSKFPEQRREEKILRFLISQCETIRI